MTNETKHTPTHGLRLPLHDEGSYVDDADGQTVTLNHYRAHIVKCVNMHDELVEAIQDLICAGDFRRGCEDLKSARETLKKAVCCDPT